MTADELKPILASLLESYPGKFVVHESSTEPYPRVGTIPFWHSVLGDLPADAVKAAITSFITSPREWPPNPGQVREKAIYLSRGELAPRGPWEAWERILEASRPGATVELTELEKRARKAAGGSREVRTSEYACRRFVDAYKEFSASEYRRLQAIPPVRAIADRNEVDRMLIEAAGEPFQKSSGRWVGEKEYYEAPKADTGPKNCSGCGRLLPVSVLEKGRCSLCRDTVRLDGLLSEATEKGLISPKFADVLKNKTRQRPDDRNVLVVFDPHEREFVSRVDDNTRPASPDETILEEIEESE